jgi:DnaJ-class molecular chaperone with C-terminal Zn finger domain
MAKRDYYDVLGVDKSSSADQIKSAYRKLAVKFHPDKNKGDKAAEEKFKEASEAYHVLSNSERKQNYDNFGHAAFENGGGGRSGFSNFDFFRSFQIYLRIFLVKGLVEVAEDLESQITRGSDFRIRLYHFSLEKHNSGKKTDIKIYHF